MTPKPTAHAETNNSHPRTHGDANFTSTARRVSGIREYIGVPMRVSAATLETFRIRMKSTAAQIHTPQSSNW
jgi:hypothetical protein